MPVTVDLVLQQLAHPAMWIPLCGIFGLLLGSFTNVVAWRGVRRSLWLATPHEARKGDAPQAWWQGRSACPACGTAIRAVDNIPALSYLVLRGRCRHCKAEIPSHYFRTEVTFGGAFAGIAALIEPGVTAAAVMLGTTVLFAWTAVRRERWLAEHNRKRASK